MVSLVYPHQNGFASGLSNFTFLVVYSIKYDSPSLQIVLIVDILALGRIRSPTARPYSRGYILCTTKSVGADMGHTRSVYYKVVTLF